LRIFREFSLTASFTSRGLATGNHGLWANSKEISWAWHRFSVFHVPHSDSAGPEDEFVMGEELRRPKDFSMENASDRYTKKKFKHSLTLTSQGACELAIEDFI
jgi:hypothetical protein